MNDKVFENRLRHRASRLGLQLQHSRAKRIHLNDLGEYRLVDPDRNWLVAGERFDYSLADIESYLDRYEADLKPGDLTVEPVGELTAEPVGRLKATRPGKLRVV
jgi:hypothetical protein